MRLIDADVLRKFLINDCEHLDDAIQGISSIPTAFDVEEVLAHLQAEYRTYVEAVEAFRAMGWDDQRRNASGRALGISKAIKTIEIEKMKQQIKYWPLELDDIIKVRWNK